MYPLCYFMRHGETDWNAEGRLQGQTDTPLNARGRAQAAANGDRLAGLIGDPGGFDFVASPLTRTRDTMELVRRALQQDESDYRTEMLLREVCFGDWEGHTFQELEAITPGITAQREASKWHFVAPGERTESYAMLAGRMTTWLAELRRPSICVTHGGNIRCLFHLIAGMPDAEAAAMPVPQDRILRLSETALEWL